MKMFTAVFLLISGLSAHAMNSEVTAGVRMNHPKVSGWNSKDKMGFQVGYLIDFPVADVISFRTGGLLVSRNTAINSGRTPANFDRMFVDIPVTLSATNGFVSGYAGFDLGLQVSSDCTSYSTSFCTGSDEQSLVLQPVIGIELMPAPLWKIGAFYEFATTYSKNWKQTAYGFSLSYAL